MAAKRSGARILIVDDASTTLELLQRNLTAADYDVLTASSVDQALGILEGTEVDLVITDLKMPRVSGLDLVRHVRANLPDTEVIMITGYASIEGAVKAVKSGADEYLAKPFTDAELLETVKRSLSKLRSRRLAAMRKDAQLPEKYGLIGQSDAIHAIFEAIDKAAATSATVLISGESGTGKELVARAIHYNSHRAASPFVTVNCSGIPEGLLESELFGHLKGSFTGAIETRAGFFQTADRGTIFLDEIGETGLAFQAKLLRVLESREVLMVGATTPQSIDVRIIAATNKDLASLVKKGSFRDDLFYRLNVVPITLPPLRQRADDVLILAQFFAARYAKEFGKPTPRFSDEALELLRTYAWPGNVRELQNIIQRLIVMTDDGIVDVPDLPPLMRFSALRRPALDRTLAEVEAEYIRNVLASVSGNKTRAAEVLGIDRKTLRDKLKAAEPPPST